MKNIISSLQVVFLSAYEMHLGGSMELGHLDILTIHAILIIKDNCVFCLIRRFDQE